MNTGCRFGLRLALKGSPRAFFGPGPVRLLRLVRSGKSLNKAAEELGMAYSKAWRIIKDAESEFGFALLHSSIGGRNGGGSKLTERGKQLLEVYDRIEKELQDHAEELYCQYVEPLLNPRT